MAPTPGSRARQAADLMLAVGPRLGEATTDGYTLVTPDHPGQTLVHVHPDPNELGRVYHADLPICADMGEFAEMLGEWRDPDLVHFSRRRGSAQGMARMVGAAAAKRRLSSTSARASPRCASGFPRNTIICNGAGNFSGWWHRYWHYGPIPVATRADQRAPWATDCPPPSRPRCAFGNGGGRVAGDGDFLMNGQELATAAQYGADLPRYPRRQRQLRHDRMHQEK